MANLTEKTLNRFGLLAPVWLVIGVTLCGALYPGYHHLHQALSELHAAGSPVANLTPWLNHYPLSILFAGFGWFLLRRFTGQHWLQASAVMIILHGIATFFAGYFPCDIGCNPESESTSQLLHGIAAMVLSLSILLAPIPWIFSATKILNQPWFAWCSAACVVTPIALMPAMITALETNHLFGLYQRLNYGVSLCWVFLLALLISRLTSDNTSHSLSEQSGYI